MFKSSPVKEQMCARERILAALQRKPVDRIPFVPLIDTYTVLDMPGEVQQAIQTASSEGYWQGMLQAMREIGCDIMLRHVDVFQPTGGAPHLSGLGRFQDPVKTSSRMDGSVLIETLETPIGTLTGSWGFTERHGWIPHPLQHVVNNQEELKIFDFALDHLSPEPPAPDYKNFLQAEAAVGSDGIATTSLLNTPLMHLIETCWGLENTYYLLQDHPQVVESVLEKLHKAQRSVVERIAESPAKVVIQYENTSSTLLSPRIFHRYCLPVLNEYAEILKSADKIFLVHMCGKLSAFIEDLASGKFAGICDISPQPTGDLSLDQAAVCLEGKVVIGGIDANTFIAADLFQVEQKIAALIERLKPHRGVLLGSADTAPRGTPVETFRLVHNLVNTLGSYLEHAGRIYQPGELAAAAGRIEETTRQASSPNAKQAETELVNMHQVLLELARRLDGKRPEVSGVIRFNLKDDAIYRLFIEKGCCRIEASDGSADSSITTSSKHLLALFTGKLNPMAAFMTRKIKFEGNLQLLGVLTAAAE